VRTGAERAADAGENDGADLAVRDRLFDGSDEPRTDRLRERVDGRMVDRDDRDLAVARERHELRASTLAGRIRRCLGASSFQWSIARLRRAAERGGRFSGNLEQARRLEIENDGGELVAHPPAPANDAERGPRRRDAAFLDVDRDVQIIARPD